MSGCRISKVTDKRTGRTIHVLRDTSELPHRGRDLIGESRNIAEGYGHDLAAWIVIGVGKDGSYLMKYRAGLPFSVTLLAAYAREIITREVVTNNAAIAMFRWLSGEDDGA